LGDFAYNEIPTYAVAIACWFVGRVNVDAPFFHVASFDFKHLIALVDESHQKFIHHCPH
jgi:hypothetical protein